MVKSHLHLETTKPQDKAEESAIQQNTTSALLLCFIAAVVLRCLDT